MNVSAPGSPLVLLAPDPQPSTGLAPRTSKRAGRAAVSPSATASHPSSAPGAPQSPALAVPDIAPQKALALALGNHDSGVATDVAAPSTHDFSGMLSELQATTADALDHDSLVAPQPAMMGAVPGRAAAGSRPAGGHTASLANALRPAAPSSVLRWTAFAAPATNVGIPPKEHQPAAVASLSRRAPVPLAREAAEMPEPSNGRAVPLPPDRSSAPVAPAPTPKMTHVPETPQSLVSDMQPSGRAKDHVEASSAIPAMRAVPSQATGAQGADPASRATGAGDQAVDQTMQSPLSESDAATANLSADNIAFGARLVAREIEQPSQPVSSRASQPVERPTATSAAGAGSATPASVPEAATHAGSSRNGTSSGAAQDKNDSGSETDAPLPAGARSEHAEGNLTAHADPPGTPAGTHHMPVPEPAYAPAAAREPETGNAMSVSRTPVPPSSAGVRVPETAAPMTPATGPARDIALRLNASDNSAVEVRLSERAGEVHVAVRSADPSLTESVRARLPELVDRLNARGFETEIWRPEQPAAAERGGSHPNPDSQREQPSEQQPGNGRQKRDQAQPEWMEELSESLRQPNAVNRSTNR